MSVRNIDGAPLSPGEASGVRETTFPSFFATVAELAVGDAYDPHVHDEDQLVWMETGRLSVAAAGREWVVRSDHLVWIPAGVAHRVEALAPGRLTSLYVESVARPSGARWSRTHAVQTSELAGALLRHLGASRLTGGRMRRCGEVLFDELAHAAPVSAAVALPSDPRARNVARSILDEPDDPREIRDWADELGVSAKTIARAFLAETGSTFREWRVEARMQAARDHLRRGERVGETARLVGYDSTSSFIAAFQKRVGVTPSVYATRDAG